MRRSTFRSASFRHLYGDWGAEWCPDTGTCPVWVRVDGGHVIYIAQEFYE